MKRFLWILAISLLLFACGDDSSSGSSEQVEPLTPQEQIDDTTTTSPVGDTSDSFTDPRDGKTYKTVTMGKLTWMAENLNYSDEKIGQGDERYTWAEAQIACPDGWHLSDFDEWVAIDDWVWKHFWADSLEEKCPNWALKSTTGWDNDTIDGEIIVGNGGNTVGLNLKPMGICEGSECRYLGRIAAFWIQMIDSQDELGDLYFFHISTSGYNSSIERDARLNVRCVNDKNTIYESLSKCTREREGVVAKVGSEYYKCKDLVWVTPTLKEKLDFALGECNSANANKRYPLQDSVFMCAVWNGGSDYRWNYTPEDSAFIECAAKGDTLCEVGVAKDLYVMKNGYWKKAYVSDVFGDCTEDRIGEIVKLGRVDYICRESWDMANSIEVEFGACDDSKLYDTLNLGAKYICVDHSWRLATRIDDELGFCFDDGAVGEYDGHKYICDAKDHKWYYEMIDERDGQKYKAIWVEFEWDGDELVMAEDLKFGGDSLYTWADAQTACPDGWHIPSDAFVRKLRNEIHNNKGLTISTRTLMSQSGWKVNGSNWSGMNLQPNAIDTIKSYVYDGVKDTSYYVHDNYKLNSWFWLSDEEGSYAGIQERVDENGEEDYVMFRLDISDFDTPVEKATVRCIKE